MLLLILFMFFAQTENKRVSDLLSNSVYFINAGQNKIPEEERNKEMEYKIMRLFPPIYDEIFEGKAYDGTNYWSVFCLPARSYYDPERQDEFRKLAFDYYNGLFKGKNIAEVAELFEKEKNEIDKYENEIDKYRRIFTGMHLSKRKEGRYDISYQVAMEDPMSKQCAVAIGHEIYLRVDEETGIIETVGVGRMLRA